MSVVDLATRKQYLPSDEEQAGDHLDHLGWDASLLGLYPFKRASMAWPNSLTVGSALSSSTAGRGMIELRAALVPTVSRR